MAAQAPREGLEYVPGTMEEVGVELLKHVDDPQDVVAYGGYGFWAPSAAIAKVKGAESQELTNAPIAPLTAPYVDDDEYVDRETDQYGQPVEPDPIDSDADPEANKTIDDVGVDEKATEAKDEPEDLPEKVSEPTPTVGGEDAIEQPEEEVEIPEKVSAVYGDTDGKNPEKKPEHDAANTNDTAAAAAPKADRAEKRTTKKS